MNHSFQPSEKDTFTRLTLLPRISKLGEDERAAFDQDVVARFAPDLKVMQPWTVHEILRRLEMEDLMALSESIDKTQE